jgi:hypothetical protein
MLEGSTPPSLTAGVSSQTAALSNLIIFEIKSRDWVRMGGRGLPKVEH